MAHAPSPRDIFMELHTGLPRQSCGSVASTYRALSLIEDRLPPALEIADLGCGPGSSVIPLALKLQEAQFLAVDLYAPFIEEMKQRAVSAGCNTRIAAEVGDMIAPPALKGSLDLIWCEGAIYNVGIEKALREWAVFLKPDGVVVFNEPVWLSPPEIRPEELTAFWTEYPDMTDDPGVRAAIKAAEFDLIDTVDLIEADWWDEYYDPLTVNLKKLDEKYAGEPAATPVLENTRTEIAMRRQHAEHYNYRFYCVDRP